MVLLFLLLVQGIRAQENITTFGIQFKPLIAGDALRTGPVSDREDGLETLFTQRTGTSFGAVIRHGINDVFSLETGINITSRNFRIDMLRPADSLQVRDEFRFIAYEIPINLLVYVKFRERLYLNAAGGISIDMFPSDVETRVAIPEADYFHRTFYSAWIKTGLNANVGMEYRVPDVGYFYLGATWHQPFRDVAFSQVGLKNFNGRTQNVSVTPLSGTYITLDLRYFFPGDSNESR